MDVFDKRILSVLKDGNPRPFTQLLDEVGFSHNTLKLHLKKLLKEGLLVREESPLDEPGRPKYAYTIPLRFER
jgi:DNA-binding Lrp family transcriptional regulator